jgi:hypothetical protein
MRRNERLISASLALTIMFIVAILVASPIVRAQTSDFTLNATPSNLCVNPGVNAVSAISVQSVGGFAGTVNLGDSIGPTVTNGPTLSPIPSSVTLAAGQTINFNLTISTTTSTPLYLYTITVSGLHDATIHQATIQLTVAAGCSVGGTILPINQSALLGSLPIAVMLASVIVAFGTSLLVYRGRYRRSKAP